MSRPENRNVDESARDDPRSTATPWISNPTEPLLRKQAVLRCHSAAIVAPSVVFATYVSSVHADDLPWELAALLAFLGSCAASGLYCLVRWRRTAESDWFESTAGTRFPPWLTRQATFWGGLALAVGLVHSRNPNPYVDAWILVAVPVIWLAVIIPVDATAVFRSKPIAILWSITVPIGFCIALPAYLFSRSPRRRFGFVAIGATLLLVSGLALSFATAVAATTKR